MLRLTLPEESEEFDTEKLPDQPIEHVPYSKYVRSGEEVGWLGYPGIVNSRRPCFFSGHVSVFAERRYFIDGVAVPGVSGGPAFRYLARDKKLQILGSVTAYSHSSHTVGLMVADDCTQWPEIFAEDDASETDSK